MLQYIHRHKKNEGSTCNQKGGQGGEGREFATSNSFIHQRVFGYAMCSLIIGKFHPRKLFPKKYLGKLRPGNLRSGNVFPAKTHL